MRPVPNRVQYKEIGLVWKRMVGLSTDLDPKCRESIVRLIEKGWSCEETTDGQPRIFCNREEYPEGYLRLWRYGE